MSGEIILVSPYEKQFFYTSLLFFFIMFRVDFYYNWLVLPLNQPINSLNFIYITALLYNSRLYLNINSYINFFLLFINTVQIHPYVYGDFGYLLFLF